MYRDSLPKTEHFIRLIDSSGPKECSAVSLISNCAFSCPKSQISIVSLLTGLSLLHPEHKPIPIIGYAFTQIEKTPSQYQNEKAVNRLLDLVGSKIKNFNDFLQVINTYSLSHFALNCYGRSLGIQALGHVQAKRLLGNQTIVLTQLNLEPRGTALHSICLGLKQCLRLNISGQTEEYGSEDDVTLQMQMKQGTMIVNIPSWLQEQIKQCRPINSEKIIIAAEDPSLLLPVRSRPRELAGRSCFKCRQEKGKCNCSGLKVTPTSKLEDQSRAGPYFGRRAK